MKKFTKFCLIFAAVFLVIGIGMTTAAAAMGVQWKDLPMVTYNSSWSGWPHWYGWNNDWSYSHGLVSQIGSSISMEIEDDVSEAMRDVQDDIDQSMRDLDEDMADMYEEMDAYWSEPFDPVETLDFVGVQKLDVDMEVGGVQIIPVDDVEESGSDTIRVKVGPADDDGKYRVYLDDGNKLCVETRWKRKKGYHYGVNHSRRIQILVPRGYQFKDVDIEINAGALDAEELLAKSLDASMNAGTLEIRNGNVEEFEGEVNAGTMHYMGTVSREVEGTCNAGSMKLDLNGKREDYNYNVKASAGAITLGDESYSTLSGRQINNTGAAADMKLSCMAGSIRVSFTE